MQKKEKIIKNIINCYKAMSYFNPHLNRWICIQTLILILSRSTVAFFSLALSYFINKKTSITLLETFTISVISFYVFNRMMEWLISSIHGRFHTQFVLPSALKFVDEIIFMMLRNHDTLKMDKNPVELSSLLNKKTEARGFLGFIFHHISTPIFELIICAVLLYQIGFSWLGLFLIPVSLFYLLLSMQLIPKIKNKLMEVLKISARSAGIFSSSLEKSSLAASFGTIELLVSNLKEVNQKENLEFKRSALLNDFMATLLSLPLAVLACLFFYLGSIKVEEGLATYGSFAVLVALIMNSFVQLKNLAFAFDGLSNSLTALELHMDIFNKCKDIKLEKKEKLNIENFNSLKINGLKVFNDEKLLFDLTFSLNKGEKIFVVGKSGTGKTSLVKALLGYKAYMGEISINDIPIDLMRYPFAWMPQEYQAIGGTIKFNLSLGNSDATDEQMLKALEKVNLYKKIASIGGLDANLDYQGNNLSGGENQRLSLARCILSGNPIMLLDEPSSALDMSLEKEIFNYLVNIDKSALIIVHRLKAIPAKSKVLFMKNNQEYKVDSLENLISNDEDFKSIYFAHDDI